MTEPSFHWFLPTSGDSREVVSGIESRTSGQTPPRPASLAYLAQVARAAESAGFDAVLTPTGTWCQDAWVTTAALISQTSRLRFLVAFRPGLLSPTLAAQQAAAFQELSGNRLLLNVVTGGDSVEQRRFGDFLAKDQRYERTDEFLQIVRGAFDQAPFDFSGEYLQVEGSMVTPAGAQRPQIFFGGASPAARKVAARQADTYLTWTEPPAQVAELLDDVRRSAQEAGREITFGIRAHVITRDTHEQAWGEADRLLAAMDPKAIQQARERLLYRESEGQRRQLALNSDLDRLEIHPGLWSGYGLVRPGAGTAFVGSHEEVAALIQEYREIGVEHFILSGQPHLEEAYWFGEGVLPKFRAARQPGTAVGPVALAGVSPG